MRFQSLYSVRNYWIAGIVLAVVGVLLARVVAPGLEGKARSGMALAGQLIAVAGLVTISFGIRKRIWSSTPPSSDEPPAPGGR